MSFNYLKISILLSMFLFSSCNKEENKYIPKEAVVQSKSKKRGVAFNYQFLDDVNVLGKGISWSYNWGPSQSVVFDQVVSENELDFCPMAWNGINEASLREYISRHPECEYLLAFNEPNLVDQANMTPQQAADKWTAVKTLANELGLKVISPAMNYGTLANYSDPIVWLDEFFTLVPISDFDGIAVHCYMAGAGSVKSYIERFRKYNKPIWLTEFCAWDGLNADTYSVEGQQKYLSDMINYLESDPLIFRYAWFIPRGGGSEDNFPYMFLLKNSTTVELTELGMIYTQMSTQDKEVFYVEQQQIEAEHYSSICIAESAGTNTWVNGPRVRRTTDAPNETLELFNFLPGQWVEYQIEIDRAKEFNLEVRYATFVDTNIEIEIDGQLKTTYLLANTSQEYIWSTANIPISLEVGKQTIRFNIKSGTVCLNWLKII